MTSSAPASPAIFLSTPSARRATLHLFFSCVKRVISIHALREEGDVLAVQTPSLRGYFYPRPPRGGRLGDRAYFLPFFLFLSTPSARRATILHTNAEVTKTYFYPRPPRGGRRSLRACRRTKGKISIHALREEGDETLVPIVMQIIISIHALREEGDTQTIFVDGVSMKFLSTPSARRATSLPISSPIP